jgi:hypothetical protein
MACQLRFCKFKLHRRPVIDALSSHFPFDLNFSCFSSHPTLPQLPNYNNVVHTTNMAPRIPADSRQQRANDLSGPLQAPKNVRKVISTTSMFKVPANFRVRGTGARQGNHSRGIDAYPSSKKTYRSAGRGVTEHALTRDFNGLTKPFLGHESYG